MSCIARLQGQTRIGKPDLNSPTMPQCCLPVPDLYQSSAPTQLRLHLDLAELQQPLKTVP